MADVAVDCMRRWNPRASERRSIHLGGAGGDHGLLTRLEVTYRMNCGTEAFFITAGDARIEVAVRGAAPNQFPQRGTEHMPATTLLSLPECPATHPTRQHG